MRRSDDFDPTSAVRWGLIPALAWVGSGSLQAVAACWQGNKRTTALAVALARLHAAEERAAAFWSSRQLGPPGPQCFAAASPGDEAGDEEKLLTVLRAGTLPAWGDPVVGDHALAVDIQPGEWESLRILDGGDVGTRFKRSVYRSVRVDQSRLRELFPTTQGAQKRSETALPVREVAKTQKLWPTAEDLQSKSGYWRAALVALADHFTPAEIAAMPSVTQRDQAIWAKVPCSGVKAKQPDPVTFRRLFAAIEEWRKKV